MWKALGLPEEEVPAPERQQLNGELIHSGTLVWILQQMCKTYWELEQNILEADTKPPDMWNQMLEWKAKRTVLGGILAELLEIKKGDPDGDQGNV